jgi:hypothetical protein
MDGYAAVPTTAPVNVEFVNVKLVGLATTALVTTTPPFVSSRILQILLWSVREMVFVNVVFVNVTKQSKGATSDASVNIALSRIVQTIVRSIELVFNVNSTKQEI